MPCYCNAPNVLEVTNITVAAGDTFTLTYIPAQTLIDYNVYNLFIPQAFPAIEGTEAVQLTDGTGTYPVYDRFGNIVRAGQMKRTCSRPYRIGYGSDGAGGSPHFVILSEVSPRIRYNPTAILSVAQSTPVAASAKGVK